MSIGQIITRGFGNGTLAGSIKGVVLRSVLTSLHKDPALSVRCNGIFAPEAQQSTTLNTTETKQ